MRSPLSASELLLVTVIIAGLTVAGWQFFGTGRNDVARGTGQPAGATGMTVPTLSPQAAAGRSAFDAQCAECHGIIGGGTNHGPPLVHDIYNPGHHADEAFRRAVRQGVVQHHWPYGNMPPQPQVTNSQIDDIVRYVRELQQANGITYRPHRM